MNEAPKKIWLETEDYNESMLWFLQMKTNGATPYIRADLVDGLVEALDQLLDDMGDNGLSVCPAAKEQARAALKALEEE